MLAISIFIISFSLLVYAWVGYISILFLLTKLIKRKWGINKQHTYPKVSIFIAAYNEESVIEDRILNLLSLEYPKKHLQILIGSDGSEDNTVRIAKQFSKHGIEVVDFEMNRGRADVHNDLMEKADGDIVVFTDADTIFDKYFIDKIVEPFTDPSIGAAVGYLSYEIKGGSIGKNEGAYWRYELIIKKLENKLGILNNGVGACMAIRKNLFKKLAPVDDVDTATVIDILFQGYKIYYQQEAKAYDSPPHNPKSEYKMRVRGTSKTIRSLVHRASIFTWIKNPIVTWSVLSHRVLRYISPLLMICLLWSTLVLYSTHLFFGIIFILQIIFYLTALFGWMNFKIGKEIPIAISIFSFCVAMMGMFVGLGKAIKGNVKVTYKTDDGF